MPEQANNGDKYQVVVNGRIEGQATANIFYFGAVGPIDDVELRIIVALWECYRDIFLLGASSAWSIDNFTWKRVSPTLGVEHIFVPQDLAAPQGNAAALPSFTSAVISKRTDTGGRSGRGRMYMPAIPEADAAGSILAPNQGYWLRLVAFAACLAQKFITLGDPPPANAAALFLYSRKLGGTTFPLGANGFKLITSLVPHRELGTTRSRKVGRGA